MLNKFKKSLLDKDKGEIIKKGFSFFTFSFTGLVAGYFYTFFIAQKFGATVNGLIGLSFSIFMICSIFGKLGLDLNIVKYYSNSDNVKNDTGIFYISLLKASIFSVFISFLVYTFREELCINLLEKPNLVPYIFWTCLAVPLWVIILICASYFRARKQNNIFSFLNASGRFLLTLLFFEILSLYSSNDIITIQAHFYALLVLAVFSLISVVTSIKKINFKTTNNSWSFLRASFPMMLSSTIIILLGWIDTFILGIFEDEAVVGIYTIALKIATLTSFSLQAINSILAPKIAKAYDEQDLDLFKSLVKFSTKLNFFITLIIVTGIIMFSKFALGLFGEEFKEGSVLLIILCVGQFINSFSGSVGIILQMTGNQKFFRNIVFLSLILNILLNLILTPYFKAVGVAIATVISMAMWNIIGSVYLKRKLNLVTYYQYK